MTMTEKADGLSRICEMLQEKVNMAGRREDGAVTLSAQEVRDVMQAVGEYYALTLFFSHRLETWGRKLKEEAEGFEQLTGLDDGEILRRMQMMV